MNTTPTALPIRLVVCVSGGGTTLQNLIDRIDDGRLRATIAGVVASKAGIGSIPKAERAGIPVAVCARRKRSIEEHSREIFDFIREKQADLVVLGGFLSILAIPPEYADKVINIHPALIPAFCGRGFHGEAVHRAAIEMGVKLSGCTVHFADDTYDTGPIIVQRAVPVLDDDTPTTLAARVFEAECQALPDAIALFAEGRLQLDGRRVRVLSETSIDKG